MAKFIQEFKEFAVRGNMMDMAVGVIVGGAFGKIVSSLLGGVDFKDLSLTLKHAQEAVTNDAGEVVKEAVEAVTWNYGAFIQQCIDFLIIAFVVFLMVKGINHLTRKKKVEEPAPEPAVPEPSKEEVLLTEIRDLLKNK